MPKLIVGCVLLSLALGSTLVALDGKKAMYVGGTITTKLAEKTEGRLNTDDETNLIFIPDKGEPVPMPYARIKSFEYGQRASFRTKTAIFVSPFSLFSKSRRHFYSFLFDDADGKEQGIILQVGKDLVRPLKMVIEVRTGKELTYQDEEAKKNFAK